MVNLIFPGQGSQYAGMGSSLNREIRSAAALFEKADEVLGIPLSGICFNGPQEKLNATEFCQPAILAVGCACWAALKEYCPEIKISMFAGHSLGEFTALVAAGSLRFSDALRLVRKRGLLMSGACDREKGAMFAVIGLERDELGRICEDSGVCMANINCPGQTVVSGKLEDIESLLPSIAERRGRAVRLKVDGAFHSEYMRDVAGEFARELDRVDFKAPSAPVLSNVNAGFHGSPDSIRELLARQLYSPVLWEDSVLRMACGGDDMFIEAGPGRVLSKMVAKICPRARVASIEDRATLEQTIGML